eukprot:tig00020629_g12463.t1
MRALLERKGGRPICELWRKKLARVQKRRGGKELRTFCNKCGHTTSYIDGSTTNAMNHQKSKHPDLLEREEDDAEDDDEPFDPEDDVAEYPRDAQATGNFRSRSKSANEPQAEDVYASARAGAVKGRGRLGLAPSTSTGDSEQRAGKKRSTQGEDTAAATSSPKRHKAAASGSSQGDWSSVMDFLGDQKKKLDDALKEATAAKKEATTAKKESEKAARELAAAKQAASSAKEETARLSRRFAKASQEIKEIENERKTADEDLNRAREKITTLRDRLSKSVKAKDAAVKDAADRSKEIQLLREQHTTVCHQKVAATEEAAASKKIAEAATKEIHTLRDSVQRAHNDVTRLDSQLDKAKKKEAEMQKTIDGLRIERDSLAKDAADRSKEIQLLREQHTTVCHQKVAATEEAAASKKIAEAATKEIHTLRDSVQRAHNDVTRLDSQLDKAKKKEAEMQKTIDGLRIERDNLARANAALEFEKDALAEKAQILVNEMTLSQDFFLERMKKFQEDIRSRSSSSDSSRSEAPAASAAAPPTAAAPACTAASHVQPVANAPAPGSTQHRDTSLVGIH